MADIGSIVSAVGNIADVANGVASAVSAVSGSSSSGKGPVRGARLEYDVPAIGGRILIKEPFGYWLGLTPVYPAYGTFKGKNKYTVGKHFTKRGGFRFKSYTILLVPGTKITVPKATAAHQRRGDTGTESRQLGNISIGVSDDVTVREFIEFLKSNKQSSHINGIISPTLRKYQWGGVLHRAGASSTNPGGIISDLGGLVDTAEGILGAAEGLAGLL